MSELAALVKRAKKFSTSEVSGAGGISVRTVQYLFAGHTSVTMRTVNGLRTGVRILETKAARKAAKTKNSGKAAKKQSPSRDAQPRRVAKGGA